MDQAIKSEARTQPSSRVQVSLELGSSNEQASRLPVLSSSRSRFISMMSLTAKERYTAYVATIKTVYIPGNQAMCFTGHI